VLTTTYHVLVCQRRHCCDPTSQVAGRSLAACVSGSLVAGRSRHRVALVLMNFKNEGSDQFTCTFPLHFESKKCTTASDDTATNELLPQQTTALRKKYNFTAKKVHNLHCYCQLLLSSQQRIFFRVSTSTTTLLLRSVAPSSSTLKWSAADALINR